MGADAYTKQIVCNKTAALYTDTKASTVDADLLTSEHSTLSLAKAVELVNKCSNLNSHKDELDTFQEVGSKTPILPSEIGSDNTYEFSYVWFNLIGFIILHIIGLSGAVAAILGYCKIWTTVYCKYMIIFLLRFN